MRLQARFIQLPLTYDAELPAAEVLQFGEGCRLSHSQRFEGNDCLPLISIDGEPENDVLASVGASLGRTRLMRLSAGAEATPHVRSPQAGGYPSTGTLRKRRIYSYQRAQRSINANTRARTCLR
jgi:hypothetical protein